MKKKRRNTGRGSRRKREGKRNAGVEKRKRPRREKLVRLSGRLTMIQNLTRKPPRKLPRTLLQSRARLRERRKRLRVRRSPLGKRKLASRP